VAGVPYVTGLDWSSGQALGACEGVRACSRTALRWAAKPIKKDSSGWHSKPAFVADLQ
jgi:hypothetical protein